MLFFSRWKTTFILGLVALGILLAAPNGMSPKMRDAMPPALQNTINLGLDLQGGAHMLLEVDLSSVLTQSLANERIGILTALRDERIRAESVTIRDGAILGRLRNADDMPRAMEALRAMSVPVDPTQIGSAKTTIVEQVGEQGFRVQITDEQIEAIRKRTIDQSIEVLRDRIDPSGTTEMTLVREGDERILLQVPGAKNVEEIKDSINKTANLSFHMVHKDSDNPTVLRTAAETGRVPSIGTKYFPYQEQGRGPGLIVEERTRITGECLENASPGVHPENGGSVVNFKFNFRCSRLFGEMTAKNLGQRFAVVLDDQIITAPTIQSAITGGSGYIEGSFTPASASDLSRLLNAGALPAKLLIVEERTVSAELGDQSIQAGRIASIIGLIGVGLFMWLSYGARFGTIANIALATNIALIAGALTLMGATLTLPGIAGIILTIGMAVDANVLIFERIREETYNGRPPVNAIETGYRLSLAPILDANITTLIAAVTLYFVGSGPVRGFAVTLAIGILTSVFTAVVFARLLTATWLRGTRPKTLPIIKTDPELAAAGEKGMRDFSLVKLLPIEPKVPFISGGKIAGVLSVLAVIASVFMFSTKGLNYGIDFTGGVVEIVDFQEEPPEDVQNFVQSNFPGSVVQNIQQPQGSSVPYDYVRIGLPLQLDDAAPAEEGATGEEVLDPQQQAQAELLTALRAEYGETVKSAGTETVSGKVSGELRRKGTIAVLLALGLVLAYIWFRFEWQFGLGAVAALLHDVVLTIGVFSLTGIEFNLAIIAAILTIVGYSLNDTVIVYDRIRENLRKFKKRPLSEVLNLSINDTLSRTILTSMTTLLALFALYILGGAGLRGFSFAMIWGVAVGTYSSIFVASPLLQVLKLKRGGRMEQPKEALADVRP